MRVSRVWRRVAAAVLTVTVVVGGVVLPTSPAGASGGSVTLEIPAAVSRGQIFTATLTLRHFTGTTATFDELTFLPGSWLDSSSGSAVLKGLPGAFSVNSAVPVSGNCTGPWTATEVGGSGQWTLTAPTPVALAAGQECVVSLSVTSLKAPTVDSDPSTDVIDFMARVIGDIGIAVGSPFDQATFLHSAGDMLGSAQPLANLDDPIVDQVSFVPAGSPPSGTVSFTLFGPAPEPPLFTKPTFTCTEDTDVAVVGPVPLVNGTATSPPITPTAPGYYTWVASFDSTNLSYPDTVSQCGEIGQTSEVIESPLTVDLTVAPSSLPSPGGDFVHTVKLTRNEGSPSLSSLDHDSFGDLLTVDTTSGAMAMVSNTCDDVLSVGMSIPSTGVTCTFTVSLGDVGFPAVGTTRASTVIAQGTLFNGIYMAPTYDEDTVTIQVLAPGPTVTRQASAGVVVGGSITDSVTLTGGGGTLGGTITYSLYRASQNCTGTPVATRSETVNGTGTYTSDPYVTKAAGDYRWLATYSGSSGNAGSTGTCSDANQTVTVAKASPTLSKTATAGQIGQPITSTGTLTNGFTPTGTVTFRVFSNAACTGSPIATRTGTVQSDGTATSASFTPSAAGTYRWTASYGGDTNNNLATAACGSPSVVTKRPTSLDVAPTLVRFWPFKVTLGSVSARLTGQGAPVGGQSVTFKSGGVTLCTAPTNSLSGVATCKPTTSKGRLALLITGRVQATYAGNATYLPSSDSAGRFA